MTTQSGLDRFRSAVRRVIQTNRSLASFANYHGAGAEQGIDPRKPITYNKYSNIVEQCTINLYHYSTTKYSSHRLSNTDLTRLLDGPNDDSSNFQWAKVRWIDVDGISWDVMHPLALRYDIHPLALQNLFRTSRFRLSSTVEYYGRHLYIRIVRHELVKQKIARDRGGTVDINASTMHLFLFRDGTVLTVSCRHGSDFFAPIQSRLIFAHDSLRRTCDASLLVHAALDLTVDHILEVVEECRASLLELERRVLLRPTMDVVHQLHVLQDGLNRKRASIGPIQSLVFNLRRYDSDRAAALVSDEDHGRKSTTTGYLTHKTKTYLADVIDHIEYALVSIDMFTEETENLINYAYNMASNQMNDTMKRLTLVTIIFLPLTFLSGYFGMNFGDPARTTIVVFWRDRWSDAMFWAFSLPFAALITMLFLGADLIASIRDARRKGLGY